MSQIAGAGSRETGVAFIIPVDAPIATLPVRFRAESHSFPSHGWGLTPDMA
jgi:hypothetical protein